MTWTGCLSRFVLVSHCLEVNLKGTFGWKVSSSNTLIQQALKMASFFMHHLVFCAKTRKKIFSSYCFKLKSESY